MANPDALIDFTGPLPTGFRGLSAAAAISLLSSCCAEQIHQ